MRWAVLAVAALVGGCEVPRTELVVRVDSELAWGPGQRVQSVVLNVRRGSGGGPLRSTRTSVLGVEAFQQRLPLYVGLVPADDDLGTPVWVEALGCRDPSGCTPATAVVAQRAVVGFVRGETLEVPLLFASACAGAMCRSDERCAADGSCEPATRARELLRPYDGGSPPVDVVTPPMDATGDAAVRKDVATDAREEGIVDAGGPRDDGASFDVPTPIDAGDDGGRPDVTTPGDQGVMDDVPTVDRPDAGSPRDAPDAGEDVGAPTDGGQPVDVGTPPVDAGPRCVTPLTDCGGACVNLQTDASHCGVCGLMCTSGSVCTVGTCGLANDARASARVITLVAAETVVTGTTVGATHDGPAVPCLCTSGPDVWFRFTLAQRELVYVDTAGSTLNTSIAIVDASGDPVAAQPSAGNANPGLCNDNGDCPAGASGFNAGNSRTAGLFNPGTWYVVVGGCGAGVFTLRVQHISATLGLYLYEGRLEGDGTSGSVLVGPSRTAGACGGTASGEDVRWFVTCGGTQQFFSLCASDGGTFSRQNTSGMFDPALYIRSGLTNSETACNDDGGTMGGSNCQGTGGDTGGFGSRLNNVTTARGLHALVVDERTGGIGMSYTLRYIVR